LIIDDVKFLDRWFTEQSLAKTVIVKGLIDQCILEIAAHFGVIVISNPTNTRAYERLYDGASTKPAYLNKKTETEGPLGGFITPEPDLPSAIVKLQGPDKHEYGLIKRRQSIQFRAIESEINHEQWLKVVADKEGRLITSDLDILMIVAKADKERSIIPESFGFGSILSYEYDVAIAVNNLFSHKMQQETGSNQDFGPIVRHGPFNRFYKTTKKFIHYPLSIYHTNVQFEINQHDSHEHQTLFNHLHMFSKQGYIIEKPDLWSKT
jgi:hypothetical protein